VEAGDLYALGEAIEKGEVEALLVLGHDPVHAAPGDLDLAATIARVPFSAYLGLEADFTAKACRWHIPAAHPLEAWSDALGFDGTPSITQPLIEPLYAGRTPHQLLAALAGDDDRDARALVRVHWSPLDDTAWAQVLKTGVAGSPAPVVSVTAAAAPPPAAPPAQGPATGLELNLVPDPYFRDGAFAANSWLAELPRPLSKTVWGNQLQLSAATASRLGVTTGDVVEIGADGRRLDAPVWIEPGQADDSLTLTLGFGRRVGDADPIGVNGFPLRTRGAAW